MPTRQLSKNYPWVCSPPIISAPMSGFAGPALAHAVSKAGGIGFLGGLPDPKALRTALQDVTELVTKTATPQPGATLPIGLGVLLFAQKLEDVVGLVAEFRPRAVWLFAAHETAEFARWTQAIRNASDETKIWIQIGSVRDAIHLAQSCKPDVLVLQGADAGGHGGQKGAGIISLIPETLAALQRLGVCDSISIVAAGGIVDGSAVAAALTLGADGVVMGTAFLAADETTVHPSYRSAILETEDGGQTTIRAKLFDELAGPNIWPKDFDGRALIAQSYKDHIRGVSIDEIRKSHAEAKQTDHLGFDQENRRAAIWAGTGVSLVRKKAPAAEILTEVREAAKTALENAIRRV
ncbi:inosine monophosphate dehydrogenase [Aureobasidium sp. EXF-10727]|nr:inosine monophosphate dehydrogenase [Aureobasidium sp. EXF-10727]